MHRQSKCTKVSQTVAPISVFPLEKRRAPIFVISLTKKKKRKMLKWYTVRDTKRFLLFMTEMYYISLKYNLLLFYTFSSRNRMKKNVIPQLCQLSDTQSELKSMSVLKLTACE